MDKDLQKMLDKLNSKQGVNYSSGEGRKSYKERKEESKPTDKKLESIEKVDGRKNQFLIYLKAAMGNVTEACSNPLAPSQTCHYNWMKTDPLYKQAVQQIIDTQLDFVEKKLLERIDEGSDSLIMFFLKSKGKKRGYGDNLNIDFNVKAPMISFVQPNAIDIDSEDVTEDED